MRYIHDPVKNIIRKWYHMYEGSPKLIYHEYSRTKTEKKWTIFKEVTFSCYSSDINKFLENDKIYFIARKFRCLNISQAFQFRVFFFKIAF